MIGILYVHSLLIHQIILPLTYLRVAECQKLISSMPAMILSPPGTVENRVPLSPGFVGACCRSRSRSLMTCSTPNFWNLFRAAMKC